MEEYKIIVSRVDLATNYNVLKTDFSLSHHPSGVRIYHSASVFA